MEYNKYYTPTIEEFHIGFEFEVQGLKDSEITWQSISVKNIDALMLIDRMTTRVKYLDKEEIESLGWKDCDNIYNTIRWDFNDYILMFYKKDNRYLIFRDCGPNNIQTVFNGFIKNKSELKKLMQQLNIK